MRFSLLDATVIGIWHCGNAPSNKRGLFLSFFPIGTDSSLLFLLAATSKLLRAN